MSVEAVDRRLAGARAARRVAVTPARLLGALVAVSVLARLPVVFAQAVPTFFPDEYIYSALARSLAETGLPQIRGEVAHFPALLAPLLTAPGWLLSDPVASYRAAQALGALAFSLAAVPVYLLARRVGVGERTALGVAAVALVVPDAMWVSFLTAEAFAYPLALASVLAGAAALERPTVRRQAAFALLAGATTFARVQFVVLFLAYAAAILAMGLRERRLRRALAEQRPTLALLALGGGVLAFAGLGYYHGVVHLDVLGLDVLESAGTNVLVLLLTAGAAIVPGATLGLGLAVARPERRAELAFALLSLALLGGLLVQAAVYGSAVHERYTFYAVPLLAVAFARYAQRGWPHRAAYALLALALVVGATRVPLTILGQRGESHSCFLIAVHWVRVHVGDAGSASLVALGAVALAAAAAVAGAFRRGAGVAIVLCATAALSLAALAGASDFVRRAALQVRDGLVAPDPSWVDHARLGDVTLVTATGGDAAAAHLELFYNRSLRHLVTLPGGGVPDVFGGGRVRIAAGGLLTLDGKPLRGALLVDGYGSLVSLRGERPLATGLSWRLYGGGGAHRLGVYFEGRRASGWVAPRATLRLWAPPDGTLRIPLSLPKIAPATDVTVRVDGEAARHVRIPAAGRAVVSVPLCGVSYARVRLSFSSLLRVGDDFAGARAGRPVVVPGGC